LLAGDILDIDGRLNRLSKRMEKRSIANERSTVYLVGVREKLQQVQFALSMMQYLEGMDQYSASSGVGYLEGMDQYSASSGVGYLEGMDQYSASSGVGTQLPGDVLISTDDKIRFYCDCFFDLLWSAVDILGQLINEVMEVGLAENAVTFKRVANELSTQHSSSPITKQVDALIRSRALPQLEGYRHCSTHRRPVYTATIIPTVHGRAGYPTITRAPNQVVIRYLCDNPSELSPRITSREITPYCRSLRKQIEDKMGMIVNKLG